MIDARLKNGDIAVDSGGSPELISGRAAQAQRAVIRMTVPKGSFIYDRELGAEAYPPGDAARAELVFSEALAGYENTEVTSAQPGEESAVVALEIDGEETIAEVRYYNGDV